MAIDPARLRTQRAAVSLVPEPDQAEPRKRPPSLTCEGGCGKRTRDPSGLCPRCQTAEESMVVENLSIEQLHHIIAAARAELEHRAGAITRALTHQETT